MPIPKKKESPQVLSAKEKIYNQVLEWIVDGTLAPQEKLNEADLAAYFSTSRTPVREALMLLAEHGYAQVIPARGSFVSQISVSEADILYEAMNAIETQIVLLACEKRTGSDIDRLEQLNRSCEAAVAADDTAKFLQCDRAFHSAIADIAANPYLSQYLRQLQPHTYRYEYLIEKTGGYDRGPSVKAHCGLIEAIRAKDAANVAKALEEHWTGQYREMRPDILKVIQEKDPE